MKIISQSYEPPKVYAVKIEEGTWRKVQKIHKVTRTAKYRLATDLIEEGLKHIYIDEQL